ncbi:MAG: hypothetical protein ABI361_04110 [Nitrososphaera sp.]
MFGVIASVILAAGLAGGAAWFASNNPEARQFIDKASNTVHIQFPIGSIGQSSSHQQNASQAPHQTNATATTPVNKPIIQMPNPAAPSIKIVDYQIFSHYASFVTVSNSGTEPVVLHTVTLGQFNSTAGELVLKPGQQQKIALSALPGTVGSSYVLKVTASGTSSGKTTSVSEIVSLLEPVSRLGIVNPSLTLAHAQYPHLSLTVVNNGMDTITLSNVSLVRPIPSSLWQSGGNPVTIGPNGSASLSFQLDSYDYLNATKRVSSDGTAITYIFPASGTLEPVQVGGRSSSGHDVTASVRVPFVNGYQQVVNVANTVIDIQKATINVHVFSGGGTTATLTFKNNSTHAVVIKSITIGGMNTPPSGWSMPQNFVINISATYTVTITNPPGISAPDIGSWKMVTATGEVFTGSALDNGSAGGNFVSASTLAPVTSD